MNRSIFEIKQNPLNRYYFTFKDVGETVKITSQTFESRSSLEACLSQIRESVVVAQISDEENEQLTPPYFLIRPMGTFSLMGFQGETIFSSTVFDSRETCFEAIQILKKTAQHAGVVDYTEK